MSSIIPNINLEVLIDKVLAQKIQKNDRDYSHFHPSEFDQCHRKLVYRYYQSKGICSPSDTGSLIDPRLQRIFDNGHGLHERLGANLEATGMLRGVWRCIKCNHFHGKEEKLGIHKPQKCLSCSSTGLRYHELGFYDESTMLGGHVDAVLDLRGKEIDGVVILDSLPDKETHIVVDFKSIRAEAFRKLVEPKESHLVQMQIYLYLSGLNAGKFLYENKNDQSFREFLVLAKPDVIQDLVARAKILKKIVTSTNTDGKWTLPVRAHKKDNTKECVECPFRSHCWGLKK